MKSEALDQPMRPPMLASDSRPTKPAAAAADTAGNRSSIIGLAFSRMPMPAVTLVNSTIHSIQNDHVLIAFLAFTWPEASLGRWALGPQPCGFQPLGGTRTTTAPSTIMTR